MKIKSIFIVTVVLSILLSSCRYARPFSARIRYSKSLIKDTMPNKVNITRNYHFFSMRNFAFYGFYKQERIIDLSKSKTYDIIHTRRILGYTPEVPYYYAYRKVSFVEGKKTIDIRLARRYAVDSIVCKKIIFENGKRVKTENALKPIKVDSTLSK